jgi:hypothetical protein
MVDRMITVLGVVLLYGSILSMLNWHLILTGGV